MFFDGSIGSIIVGQSIVNFPPSTDDISLKWAFKG